MANHQKMRTGMGFQMSRDIAAWGLSQGYEHIWVVSIWGLYTNDTSSKFFPFRIYPDLCKAKSRFCWNVKELNLNKKISPEPVAAVAACGPRVGGVNACQMSVSRLVNLSNNSQTVCPFLFRSRKLWKLPRGYLKRHNLSREQFWTAQAGSCSALSLAS